MDCLICMERCPEIEIRFIKEYVKIPCKCRFMVHIKCYNDWRLTTTMLCPICRIHEQGIIIIQQYNNDISVYYLFIYSCIILLMLIIFLLSLGNNNEYRIMNSRNLNDFQPYNNLV